MSFQAEVSSVLLQVRLELWKSVDCSAGINKCHVKREYSISVSCVDITMTLQNLV